MQDMGLPKNTKGFKSTSWSDHGSPKRNKHQEDHVIDDYTPWNFREDEEKQEQLTDEVISAFKRLRGTKYGIQKARPSPDGRRIIFVTNDAITLDKSKKGQLEDFEYDNRLWPVRGVPPKSASKYPH